MNFRELMFLALKSSSNEEISEVKLETLISKNVSNTRVEIKLKNRVLNNAKNKNKSIFFVKDLLSMIWP